MDVFGRLYRWMMDLARHRHAPRGLFCLAFAESSFFPIPVDAMLAPMVLAQRERAWRFASLATVGSVLGGIFGWALGMWLIAAVMPIIESAGYQEAYQTSQAWFAEYGVLAVFLAGFTPIPYKVFTIAAGAASMFLPLFVIASLIGRGARFFLVAGLVYWGGPHIEPQLSRYANRIGWGTLALCGLALLYWQLRH